MIDPLQSQRIDALERAFASLAGGYPTTIYNPEPSIQRQPSGRFMATVPSETTRRMDARISALESMITSLTNSITLLNQQIANLAQSLEEQTNASNMINVNPMHDSTIDAAQNARLDSIDELVNTLNRNVNDYNQQMAELIVQYKTLQAKKQTSASNSASVRNGWI